MKETPQQVPNLYKYLYSYKSYKIYMLINFWTDNKIIKHSPYKSSTSSYAAQYQTSSNLWNKLIALNHRSASRQLQQFIPILLES